MAYAGKAANKQYSAMEESAQSKFKRDLTRFEQSVKEMQTCMASLNESASDLYGETLPRAKEFQRGLQDETTLVGNFAKDMQGVQDQLRRYHQQYDDDSDQSAAACANRSSEFVTSVLGELFKVQDIFFSESFKVSQVLSDIVSQTYHKPTPREIKLTRELQNKIEGKPAKGPVGRLARGPAGAVPCFAGPAGGHRGPGALVGGAYGSQQPQSRGPSVQIKPASRFSTPPSSNPMGTRIYI